MTDNIRCRACGAAYQDSDQDSWRKTYWPEGMLCPACADFMDRFEQTLAEHDAYQAVYSASASRLCDALELGRLLGRQTTIEDALRAHGCLPGVYCECGNILPVYRANKRCEVCDPIGIIGRHL